MYVKLSYPDTKVNFLSICEKVIEFEGCPEICIYLLFATYHFWPNPCFTNTKNVPELTRITKYQTGDDWWELPPTLHSKSVLPLPLQKKV